LKVGDVIAVREGSKKSALFQNLNTKLDKYMYPAWLTFDPGALVGTLKSRPTREGSMLDFGRVLEFYSR
jgi:ribosomal protein S4